MIKRKDKNEKGNGELKEKDGKRREKKGGGEGKLWNKRNLTNSKSYDKYNNKHNVELQRADPNKKTWGILEPGSVLSHTMPTILVGKKTN